MLMYWKEDTAEVRKWVNKGKEGGLPEEREGWGGGGRRGDHEAALNGNKNRC